MPRRPLATYLVGSFLARLADEGMGIAAALLAVERTGGVAQGAAILTAWTAPHVLAAPLTGALAAKTARPRLFYATAMTVVGASAGGVALLLGRAPLAVVFAVAFLGGCCGPLATGGLSSIVGTLVPAERRSRAYALDAAVYNASTLAAPAVIGIATALWSAGVATGALAGAAVLAACLLATLPMPRLTSTVVSLRSAVVVGLATIWRNGVLRGVTGGTCVAYLGVGALPVAAVLVATSWGSATDGSLLMTGMAAGGLTGALLVTRWRPPITPQRMVGFCLLGSTPALALAAVSPNVVVGLIGFVAAGLCDGPLLSATFEARSQQAPDHARPQVFTIGAALKTSAAACGAALVGAAAAAPAMLPLLAIAALQLFAYAALRLLARLPVRELDPGPFSGGVSCSGTRRSSWM